MIKVQFGSGENILEGWQNLQERDADITMPLKFGENEVDYILAEHVVEHVTPQQAWHFFCECYRVLKSTGVARIIVPDIVKIVQRADQDYFTFVQNAAPQWWPAAGLVWKDKPVTIKEAIQTIIFCHGHQGCWTESLLKEVMWAVGFKTVTYGQYGTSVYPELKGVDGHWKMMGLERCEMESCVVEAYKGDVSHKRFSSASVESDQFRKASGR